MPNSQGRPGLPRVVFSAAAEPGGAKSGLLKVKTQPEMPVASAIGLLLPVSSSRRWSLRPLRGRARSLDSRHLTSPGEEQQDGVEPATPCGCCLRRRLGS